MAQTQFELRRKLLQLEALYDVGRALNAGIVPNRKRRCCQRRFGAPTRGIGPLRLALAGATRSGSAGVGSPARDPLARLRRIKVESIGMTINFRRMKASSWAPSKRHARPSAIV